MELEKKGTAFEHKGGYCIKVRIDNHEMNIVSLLIMFFKIDTRGSKKYKVTFVGRPNFMIVHKNKADEIGGVNNSVDEFENQIRKYKNMTYNNYFSLYSGIYTKIYHQYYQVDFDAQELLSQTKELNFLEEIKEKLAFFLISIWQWQLKKNKIDIKIERVLDNKLNTNEKVSDQGNIQNNERDEKNKIKKGVPIDWEIDKSIKIGDFSPVFAMDEGIRCVDLTFGDYILVRPKEILEEDDMEASLVLSSSSPITYPAQIVDMVVDSNNYSRFLVLLEDGRYGNIEVGDGLIKLKTVGPTKDKSNFIKESFSDLNRSLFRSLILIFISIFIIYILINSLN